ncbi:hypothetical protein [Pseudoalteromonas rubra]|uniref:hypothetical protein n=1 Tax=Pseudoalteromonas rubra TaxID=43658 RepID=UPI000F7B0654|nr:hypothetical protein [Pseudoalteromonas rubra]
MKTYIPYLLLALLAGCSSSDNDEPGNTNTQGQQQSPSNDDSSSDTPSGDSPSGDGTDNSSDNTDSGDSNTDSGDNGSDDSGDQNEPDDSRGAYFPREVMASSPFGDSSNEVERGFGSRPAVEYGPAVPTYLWSTQRIGRILNGTVPLLDVFRVQSFYRNSTNASCFGPQVAYTGHPDATNPASASGTLPGGDLGLWLESDTDGNACAVAQTNALLSGLRDQSRMSLMTLASMVSAALDSGMSLPADGSSIDVTSEMNAKGVAGVTFSTAAITRAGSEWQYTISLTYTVSGTDYDISLSMAHTPGADLLNYSGHLTYQVEGEQGVSGLEFPGGNCAQNERTRAGSLAYERAGDNMSLQARVATLCGHGNSGMFNSDNQVDVNNKYHSVDNPDGWSENFSIFGANFDLTTLAGQYAYVWQAGVNDSNSRIFNIGFNSPSLDNGEAHFGYGTKIEDTDGLIQGFICNWAGPGNDHSMQAFSQRQFFQYDAATATYDGSGSKANIEYAPTASCSYDGTGSFVFDIDASGVLGDIALEDASLAFSQDLWAPTDPSKTVAESITDRGLSVPTVPYTWPVDE